MIPIVKEPAEIAANSQIYEDCYFCGKTTKTWHIDSNQPVCSKCAKSHKVEELVNAFEEHLK